MEERKIQKIFTKCQRRKYWNIFIPKILANYLNKKKEMIR